MRRNSYLRLLLYCLVGLLLIGCGASAPQDMPEELPIEEVDQARSNEAAAGQQPATPRSKDGSAVAITPTTQPIDNVRVGEDAGAADDDQNGIVIVIVAVAVLPVVAVLINAKRLSIP